MKNKERKLINVAQRWCNVLKKEGYEEHIFKKGECLKLKRFSRIWRRILKMVGLKVENLSVFEVGCGGCKHLVQFALNDCECLGIDCSEEVLERAEIYIQQVSRICGQDLNIELIHEDFLNYKPSFEKKFDIVFQVGVLEHFLNSEERILALKKMFDLAKSGGWVISVVPNGVHPLRREMKEKKLSGYNIPEIDYNQEILFKEMKGCGGKDISVVAHNIFNYLLFKKTKLFFLKKIIYLTWQMIPISWLPSKLVYRHAGILIAIAKK